MAKIIFSILLQMGVSEPQAQNLSETLVKELSQEQLEVIVQNPKELFTL